ncbi:MAG: chloride channel protein, partial [Prevotella sp.]|nr:chloride channel protein [Prevotella sp.]
MLNSGWFEDVLTWRKKHLSDRQFTLVLAFLVGIFAALAAFVLHGLIHVIQHLLTQEMELTSFNWLFLILPVVGIWLTMLFVRYVVRDNISHGITRILYAISSKKSRLAGHNCWSSVVASAITIGFGGSVGAEAPIVLTGSAIASNLGQKFRMNNKTLMLLVGCGAAAAIAGIFKAPIAGLVFTIEVLMIDLTMASISPILIASVTATCFTYVLVGDSQLFTFHTLHPWVVGRVPANIALGVFCGL